MSPYPGCQNSRIQKRLGELSSRGEKFTQLPPLIMKRHADLFRQIISFENLFLASRKARRGKRTNGNVMRFEMDVEEELFKLQEELATRTYWLIKAILDGSNKQEEVNSYFWGDDLFAPFRRRKGIPIGNLTSQFFANVYLNDLDHFIKEELRCRYYIRYVDDLTIFGNEKKKLWEIRDGIEDFLSRERLLLHPGKTYVSPVSAGIDHLGYVVYADHRRLRKDNTLRFRRKLVKMSRLYGLRLLSLEKINASVQSWIGHAKHADTYGLREKIFGGITLMKK